VKLALTIVLSPTCSKTNSIKHVRCEQDHVYIHNAAAYRVGTYS